MAKEMTMPRSRVEQLVIQEMPEETLVYDLERHRAHCLNRAAAVVWQNCDGVTSASAIARLLHEETGLPADEQIVWLAVGQLEKARLLEGPAPMKPARIGASRRSALKHIGIVGAAAALLPLITSIVAPTAVSAVTCRGTGASCTDSAQCCSRVCNMGTCL